MKKTIWVLSPTKGKPGCSADDKRRANRIIERIDALTTSDGVLMELEEEDRDVFSRMRAVEVET